jgi:NAD(P)-dependent dehydrogenase (short-subunit alcohol dehydrogenase family)
MAHTSPFDLSGRVALITGGGANGGIGHAIAIGMAAAGADILVSDRDAAGAERTAQEVQALGRQAVAVTCDSSQLEQIEDAFRVLDERFGRIDILVNNVGTNIKEQPESATLANIEAAIRLNMLGTFTSTQQAGRRMIASGRGGSIISIASVAGALALGRANTIYSMTKAAILQMTRELAVEWGRYHIRVNAILPAQTLVPGMKLYVANAGMNGPRFAAESVRGIPLGRLAEPEDMAGPAVFLASDAAAFVSGVHLPVDGGNLAMNAGGTLRYHLDEQGRTVWED